MYGPFRPIRCECCGGEGGCPVGVPDADNRTQTRYLCEPCQAHCTDDGGGTPEHVDTPAVALP
jgi:hypothetical protein